LGWVGNGSKIFVFSGLGWIMGLKWQICEKYMSCIYVTLYCVNAGKFVFFCENLQFGASLHHLSEIFIDDNMMYISLFSYDSSVYCSMYGHGLGWVMDP